MSAHYTLGRQAGLTEQNVLDSRRGASADPKKDALLRFTAGNLCVEAHLRDFLEHGFEVAMVRDATAGTTNEEGDGYRAAMVNFRFLAHALWTTEEAVRLMHEAAGRA